MPPFLSVCCRSLTWTSICTTSTFAPLWKDVLTRPIFDKRFLRYMAIDYNKILQMIYWICLTLTCKCSIKSNIILSRYDQLKKRLWTLKVTKRLKSIQRRVGQTQHIFFSFLRLLLDIRVVYLYLNVVEMYFCNSWFI